MAAASLVERTLACQAGMPMATRMPMIEMTIISSTSEKPRWLLFSVLISSKPRCPVVHVRAPAEFHKAVKNAPPPVLHKARKVYYTEPAKSHGRQKDVN